MDKIKKWAPVLDYVSDNCASLQLYEQLAVADVLEEYEQKYIHNRNLCKILIPHIRREKGQINIEEKIIDGENHLIIYDYINYDKLDYNITPDLEKYTIAIPINDSVDPYIRIL